MSEVHTLPEASIIVEWNKSAGRADIYASCPETNMGPQTVKQRLLDEFLRGPKHIAKLAGSTLQCQVGEVAEIAVALQASM